jgi:hypothetical protein
MKLVKGFGSKEEAASALIDMLREAEMFAYPGE